MIERVTARFYNAGPEKNNGGRPGHGSTEELWDGLLSLGKRMVAIATDDSGVWLAQGYAIARPMSLADLRVWIREHTTPHDQTHREPIPLIVTALDRPQVFAS